MVSPAWFWMAFPLLALFIIITTVLRFATKKRHFLEYEVITLGVTSVIGIGILLAGLLSIPDPRKPNLETMIVDIPLGLIMSVIGLYFLRNALRTYMRHLGRVNVPRWYELEKLGLTIVFFLITVTIFIVANQTFNITTKYNDISCCLLLILVFGTMFFPFFHERGRPVDKWAEDHGLEPPREGKMGKMLPEAPVGRTTEARSEGKTVKIHVKGRT